MPVESGPFRPDPHPARQPTTTTTATQPTTTPTHTTDRTELMKPKVDLTEADEQAIADVLLGRTVTKVSDNELELDDGTLLELVGNGGGCSCGAGDYELIELNGCDNVITKVELDNSPSGDGLAGEGHYKIFVYADNQRINLATFEGSDGNGYYGTGYTITVKPRPT